MKTNKKMIGIMLVAIAVSAGTLMSGCITLPQQDGVLHGFEVHEWGVFHQEYNCSVVYVANIPDFFGFPFGVQALKPVIYFHSEGGIDYVTVEVEISENLTTIPNATIVENKIRWTFAIENNSIVLQNSTNYEYLFYEGKIYCNQSVIAYVVDDGVNVTFYVKNIANYTLSDIFFIYGYPTGNPGFMYRGLTYVQIEKLESGEETSMTVSLKNNVSYNTSNILSSLIENGLTEKEATELIDYWGRMWFDPTNMGSYAQMIYTIPQDVYDELLPISISPKPEVMHRVGLFFVTDIPINPPTQEKVDSGLPGFNYDPELILPEVYVENQSIWTSTFNTSKWYTFPYPYIFIEKYSNHSKEVIEIMKMQVALLGEDPELFEKCIRSVQGTFQLSNSSEVPEDLVSVLCWARKETFTGWDEYREDNGKEVWALTYTTKANDIVGMITYYVDINILQVLPWTICTD